MARYPYRQQPQMVDTGDVPYVSYISEQAEPLMMLAAANAQQRYDLAQTVIAKYLEENAAAKFRDADYNTVMAKLNQDLENIKTTVKDKYDNQYGQAYPEILKGLSKAKQTYHLAQKAYEEEQKYAPIYAQLQAEGKLLFPEGDPRTKSVFNQEGQYVGGVDFSKFRERSDYDKIIEDAVVRGIDKTAVESGLINSKTAGYLMQLQQSGLAALGNTEQEIDNKIDKIAEEYAPIFEKQTTYGIDPNESKTSKQYVKEAIYRLAGSKTGRQYMADRNFKPDGGGTPNPPSNINPVFSTFEAPLPLTEKSPIITEYKKNKELFNRINTNKGKLEILESVKGITFSLQQKVTPGAIGTSLMYLDDKDKVQFNNWIEAAMLEEPEKVGKFVTKDKEGNYTFGANKAAGSVYIGNLLYNMSNNENNYLDKVTTKYNKAKQEFEKEYKPMMDYIMKNTGVTEDVAMQKIQEFENLLKFGKTFSFNDKSLAPIIKTNILSRPGEAAEIYEVKENGEVSDKPKKAKDELNNKSKVGDIINVEVDPIQGHIIMTSEKGKKYAIKSGKGSLSVASDNILNEIKEFSSTLNSSKKPQTIIQTRGGDNYLVIKDPNTLESTIFKVQKVGDKWVYSSTEPLSEEQVYGELMTRLYMSLGGTNVITPNKI